MILIAFSEKNYLLFCLYLIINIDHFVSGYVRVRVVFMIILRFSSKILQQNKLFCVWLSWLCDYNIFDGLPKLGFECFVRLNKNLHGSNDLVLQWVAFSAVQVAN